MKIGQCYKHPDYGLIRAVTTSTSIEGGWVVQVLEADGKVLVETHVEPGDWPEFEFLPLPVFYDILKKKERGEKLTVLEQFIHDFDPAEKVDSANFNAGLMEVINAAAAGRLFS